MRLVVLGNSVSLAPDKEAPGVRPYPALLGELLGAGWKVDDHSVNGGTIRDLVAAAKVAAGQGPAHAVVIQAGIVDCAPRPLARWERDLVARLRPAGLRTAIVAWVHRHRATIIARRRLIQWTPLSEYTERFGDLLSCWRDAATRLAALPILPATPQILARNPRLALEIDRYNAAMRAHSASIRFFEVEELFAGRSAAELAAAAESVHLNQEGHRLLAAALRLWLA